MRVRVFRGRLAVLMVSAACIVTTASEALAQTRETVTTRSQTFSLRVYGARGGTPVIVSSGDGGWIHLGPHAEVLAAHGFFVVGFDVKEYLERLTSGETTLSTADDPATTK